MTSRFTAGVGCRLQCTVLQLLHAYYCQDRGIGGRCCRLELQTKRSIAFLNHGEKAIVFMFVCSSSTIKRTGVWEDAARQGWRRHSSSASGSRHSLHHSQIHICLDCVRNLPSGHWRYTGGRGTTLCNTQVNCINMTTIFPPFQFFFIILSGN